MIKVRIWEGLKFGPSSLTAVVEGLIRGVKFLLPTYLHQRSVIRELSNVAGELSIINSSLCSEDIEMRTASSERRSLYLGSVNRELSNVT